jgi:hypothetical protein
MKKIKMNLEKRNYLEEIGNIREQFFLVKNNHIKPTVSIQFQEEKQSLSIDKETEDNYIIKGNQIIIPKEEAERQKSNDTLEEESKDKETQEEKIFIIQASEARTASTLLCNGLYGMVKECRNKDIIGSWNFQEKMTKKDKIIIIKTHDMNFSFICNFLNDYMGENCKFYFVCSERKDLNRFIPAKYKTNNNVVIFQYEELLETSGNPLSKIMKLIHHRVSSMIPEIEFDYEGGLERIVNMNKTYEKIKELPFEYFDSFYSIHGSHRNRGKREMNIFTNDKMKKTSFYSNLENQIKMKL